VVVIAVMALTVALGTEFAVGASGGTSGSRRSPAQLVMRSMEVAERAHSFHYASRWQMTGWSLTVVGDTLGSSGAEAVSVGGAHYSAILVRGVVYFDGDAAAFEDQLQVEPAVAISCAGTWISLQSSDQPYAQLAGSMTSENVLSELLIDPMRTSTTHMARGHSIARITGTIPVGLARLDVATRSGLPAAYKSHGLDGSRRWQNRITFSRWNAPFVVSEPNGARPFASLRGGAACPQGSASTVHHVSLGP
jgi:hypothetical protein